jgi:hypothetical protein
MNAGQANVYSLTQGGGVSHISLRYTKTEK